MTSAWESSQTVKSREFEQHEKRPPVDRREEITGRTPGERPKDELEQYEVRLDAILSAVSGSSDPPTDDERQFLLQVVRNSRLLLGLGTLPGRSPDLPEQVGPPSADPAAPLQGTGSTVELLVTAMVQKMEPPAVLRFVRGQLAATVHRLENEHVSRENITDIVIRALQRLADPAVVRGLARSLFGYLLAEPTDSVGRLQSAAVLGDFVGNKDLPEANLESSVVHHVVIREIWRSLRNRPDQEFHHIERRLVATNTFNLAMNVERLSLAVADPSRSPGPTPSRSAVVAGAQRVSRDLLGVSAAVVAPRGIAPERARRCLVALGAPAGLSDDGDDAVAAMAVLDRMGGRAGVWTDDKLEAAWISAASAVVAGLTGDQEFTPQRLFNAGVILLRLDTESDPPVIRARLILNLAGLRWTMTGHDSDAGAWGDSALSCLVNFAGAVADLNRYAQGPHRRMVELIRLLGGTATHWLSQRQQPENVVVDLARLGESARHLKVELTGSAPIDVLIREIDAGLAELHGSIVAGSDELGVDADDPDADRVRLALAVADHVRAAFDGLPSAPPWELVVELAARRRDPVHHFITGFAQFAGSPDGTSAADVRPDVGPDVGPGPLVVAGLMPRSEWDTTVRRMLQAPASMEPELRQAGWGVPGTPQSG